MEHNAYSVWKIKLAVAVKTYTEGGPPGYNRVYGPVRAEVRELALVAPSGELGKALIPVYLDRHFATNPKLNDSSKEWDYLAAPVEERLDGIVRYDDEYRGRM